MLENENILGFNFGETFNESTSGQKFEVLTILLFKTIVKFVVNVFKLMNYF